MRSRAIKPTVVAIIAAMAAVALAAPAYAQNGAGTQKQHQAPASTPTKAITTDDRPYDTQLFRLSEILGTLHYLRELCGANEGQVWREHMRELVASEGTSALRRAKLVESFNRGYRDYSRTYRSCTQPAIVAIQRYMEQASAITDGLIANDK